MNRSRITIVQAALFATVFGSIVVAPQASAAVPYQGTITAVYNADAKTATYTSTVAAPELSMEDFSIDVNRAPSSDALLNGTYTDALFIDGNSAPGATYTAPVDASTRCWNAIIEVRSTNESEVVASGCLSLPSTEEPTAVEQAQQALTEAKQALTEARQQLMEADTPAEKQAARIAVRKALKQVGMASKALRIALRANR